MVPWTHQIISLSRGILRHQAGPRLDSSADDNVRAWVNFMTLSACPSRSQMFVPAPRTVSSPNRVQRQKRVEGVSIPANLPSLSRVGSKEAGEMNIWHFQPQLRQTVSTYKEKTRKIAVGQEQPQKVRVQSVGPVPTARSPSPGRGCCAAVVFVSARPAQH